MVEYSGHLVPLLGPDPAAEPERRSGDPYETDPRDESRVDSMTWPSGKTVRRRWQRGFFEWYRADEGRSVIKPDLLLSDNDDLHI